MLLVHDSDREARLIARADFRDEVAEFAVVFVLFQAGVCLGIIRLQAHQFIARFLTPQAGVSDLFVEVSPSIQRLHTDAQESFIFRAKRRFVEKFTFHVLLLQFIRSISQTKTAKSQAWRNLPQKWYFSERSSSTKLRIGISFGFVILAGREPSSTCFRLPILRGPVTGLRRPFAR